ncbi:putative iron-regulated membrane protein [Elizabethkingia sp. YR214]|uniref:PepSY-associated TM helix domain-containing protein n=1 Tax=Elizabethkingia sp. YR214 TaxID=2135667 RepID=UPI000D30EF07|nr:PepSY-associated TM helix domain-containing protein [Elizabethkingia sp. YR214]PUB34412.1 putative iron-regulated membrane protein [Elizabethkingia sp. YR214]
MNKQDKVPKKKKGKSLFGRIVAWVHLWPSIVSGIILVVVCLSGTIIVYCDEIMDWTAGDAKYVTVPQNPQRVSSDVLKANFRTGNPGYDISEFVFFKDPERSVRIRAFSPKGPSLAMVYADPYTGEILKKDDTLQFFFVMAHFHASFLAGKTGGWIVAVSTIVFVISTITGLILWWPKKWNKTTRQASFTIKWKARFKRFNYDLHNVYGFYSLIICFILGTTGLVIFFEPLMEATVKMTNGTTEHLTDILPKQDSTKVAKDIVPFAYGVLNKTGQQEVSVWNYDRKKLGAYILTSGKVGLKSIEHASIDVYDSYTGKAIKIDPKYLQHEKTENIVWQLHLGQWWGQLGKLSTFLAGIVATSLPITGFLIWWGRRNKKKSKPAVK